MNIVFEGIDASGKTTIINYLKNILINNQKKCQVIADLKEPTPLLPIFEEMFSSNFLELDEHFKTSIYETLLFACSHFYIKEKNKLNNHITIYDRDIFTLLAYQKELIRREYPKDYEKFFKPFKQMLLFEEKKIDLLVYVQIPLEENIKRKKTRDKLDFTDEDEQKLKIFKENLEIELQEYKSNHPETVMISLDGRDSVSKNCNIILNNMQKIEINNITSSKDRGEINGKIF